MISKKLIYITLIGMTVISAGCHLLGGGGWLPGLNGGKAHFGFEAECYDEFDPDFGDIYFFHRGQFQYMDRSAGVRFHGEFEWRLAAIGFEGGCADIAESFGTDFPDLWDNTKAELSGTCSSQPKGHEGTFTVYVEDNGTPGLAGDYIEISTVGCGEDGGDYTHSAVLGGGNIWIE